MLTCVYVCMYICTHIFTQTCNRCISLVTCIYVTQWKLEENVAQDRRCGGVYQKPMKNRRETSEYSNLSTRRFTAKAFEWRRD